MHLVYFFLSLPEGDLAENGIKSSYSKKKKRGQKVTFRLSFEKINIFTLYED
jgi:hypothetical protein